MHTSFLVWIPLLSYKTELIKTSISVLLSILYPCLCFSNQPKNASSFQLPAAYSFPTPYQPYSPFASATSGMPTNTDGYHPTSSHFSQAPMVGGVDTLPSSSGMPQVGHGFLITLLGKCIYHRIRSAIRDTNTWKNPCIWSSGNKYKQDTSHLCCNRTTCKH